MSAASGEAPFPGAADPDIDSDPVLALAVRAPFAVVVARVVDGSPDAPGPGVALEYVNARAASLFARAFPDAPAAGRVGRPLRHVLPAAIAEESERVTLALANGEAARSGTWRVRTSDGDRWVVEFHSMFVPPDRTFTEFLDVTDRERLAQERARSAERLRLAFDASPDGFVLLRVLPGDGYLVEQVNVSASDLVPDLVTGTTVPPGHPLLSHLSAAVPRALGADRPVRDTWQVSRASGPVVYDVGLARLSADQVIVTFRDITVEARLQEQVAESARLASRARRLMYVALDSLSMAFSVFRVRRDGNGSPIGFIVEFVNEPAVPAGKEVRDVIGLDLLEAYPHARDSGVEAGLIAAATSPTPQRFPIVGTDAEGSRHHLEAILSRVEEDLVVASFVDVTELRAAQEELAEARDVAVAASQAKSDFLATVTHELRTPLTTMVSATELLLGGDLDDDQRSLALQQRDGARMLLALVSDILDLSKVEAGRLELELVELDLVDLVERTVSMFTAAAAAKGLELGSSIDPGLPRQLVGDPTRLQQVLLNLLSNAVKFTEWGAVQVAVEVVSAHADHVTVGFRVTDTGIGIPPGALRDIFRPFRQVSGSTTRGLGGTGLGLSIAQRLVTLMNGGIEVTSREGEGTTVAFTADLRRLTEGLAAVTDDGDALDPAEDPDAPAGHRTEVRVLLAEDNDTNRLLLARMLRSVGCQVVVAATGVQAVEAVERGSYDLILMDLRMPDMDGLSATRRIREMESGAPDRRATPILALTANATSDVVAQTQEVGMDDFLAKPVALDDLRSAVDRWARSAEAP